MIKRAFTLLELLLVIAIIAILAALLFPVIQNARQDAYKGAAITQCNQLAKAMMLYAQDTDGNYAPSTNYGVTEADPNRIWTNILFPYIKNEKVFVAPGSEGQYAHNWGERGLMTVGLNSATAIDLEDGCDEDEDDKNECYAFTRPASFDKKDSPEKIGLFALTPGGPAAKGYRGFEFNPYNGVPNVKNPQLGPPLTADRDLVALLSALPADFKKPIFARYHGDGKNAGVTPVIFAGGNVKTYSAKQILTANTGIFWRFR